VRRSCAWCPPESSERSAKSHENAVGARRMNSRHCTCRAGRRWHGDSTTSLTTGPPHRRRRGVTADSCHRARVAVEQSCGRLRRGGLRQRERFGRRCAGTRPPSSPATRSAPIIPTRILTSSGSDADRSGRADQRVQMRSLKPQVTATAKSWNPTWPFQGRLTKAMPTTTTAAATARPRPRRSPKKTAPISAPKMMLVSRSAAIGARAPLVWAQRMSP
jgi:hypothetical protein